MILYIIRHADPDYKNNTITDFGRLEADALADWLKEVPIDEIYTSPLGRAIETAAPTCKAKGITPEILPWTSESYDYMDSLKLTPKSQLSYRFSVQKGIYDFRDFCDSDRMNGINNMISCSDDFLAAYGYVREGIFYKITRHCDKAVAVFCHGGFGCAWISHLLNTAPGVMYPQIGLSTSSVTTFEFPNDESGYVRPILRRLSDIYHIRRAGLDVNRR